MYILYIGFWGFFSVGYIIFCVYVQHLTKCGKDCKLKQDRDKLETINHNIGKI